MAKLFKGKLPPLPVVPKSKYPGNNIGNRLELYCRSLDMKGSGFSKHIGISQGSYSDLKNNKSHPSCLTIISIIKLGECDIIWLLTGKE